MPWIAEPTAPLPTRIELVSGISEAVDLDIRRILQREDANGVLCSAGPTTKDYSYKRALKFELATDTHVGIIELPFE